MMEGSQVCHMVLRSAPVFAFRKVATASHAATRPGHLLFQGEVVMGRKPREIANCEKCGEPFKKNERKQRFCSSACAGKSPQDIRVNCSLCGIEFKKTACLVRGRDNHFCCMEHAQEHRKRWRRKASNCALCGKELSGLDLKAYWGKSREGVTEFKCRECKANRVKARAKEIEDEKTSRMMPHLFNCYECGSSFWRTTIKTTCSAKCVNKRAHRECMANPKRHISMVMRISIGQALRGEKKRVAWSKLLGYGPDELMAHIERTMLAGMSWDNYGSAWHIDHILPVSRFNYQRPTDPDFKRCWALSNLRALWAVDNIRKGKKIDKPFQPCLAVGV
jgi:hypothetical protein